MPVYRFRRARAVLRRRAGQALTEYMIIAAVLVLSMSIFAVFLYTFKGHSERVVSLVGSEYP